MEFLVKAYLWAAGKKTYTGAALVAAGKVLNALGQSEAAVVVDKIGDVLLMVGLADKGARVAIKPVITESRTYNPDDEF